MSWGQLIFKEYFHLEKTHPVRATFDGRSSPMSHHEAQRRAIFRAFKNEGLTIKSDAVKALLSVLSPDKEEDPDRALELILGALKSMLERKELKSNLIDVAAVEAVVVDLSKNEEDLTQEAIEIFDAFSMPNVRFDPARKSFSFVVNPKRPFNAPATSRAQMFRDRYLLVQQRLLRNELFCAPLVTTARKDYLQIATIDSLLGTSGVRCLLGILTQVEEKQYYLEDLTGHVALDLSNATATPGIFTENAMVVVEGEVVNGLFRVVTIGFPPPEPREVSIRVMRSMEIFGPGFTPQQLDQLKALEMQAHDVMMIMVSDVHLDRPHVLDKLRTMFAAYNGIQGHARCLFVLMGDFTSKPLMHGQDGRQQLIACFDSLANLLKEEAPILCQEARFIFIPGPNDPGSGSVLPRGPLPSIFTKSLAATLQHVTFTSNPCRIRLYSQDLILFRDDILKKMLRHCIIQGHAADQEGGEVHITEHLVKSLLDQGHLCPLALSTRPILWEYDNALRLYPLPDVVVLADHCDHYSWRYEGCRAVNPGSFPVDFTFMVYRPATGDVEFSRID